MKPILLSELEAHCIEEHGVKSELVCEIADRHPDKRELIVSNSHMLMHTWGAALDHTHPEFEIGGEKDEVLHERLASGSRAHHDPV